MSGSRIIRVGSCTAGIWAAWLVLVLSYEQVRGLGGDFLAPHDAEGLERRVFGGTPTRGLQDLLFERGATWLDSFGYMVHGLWFGLPFAFGLVIMIYERRKLMEFFGWLIVAGYLADIFFVFLPVKPPWMESGVTRILFVNSYYDYVDLDPNPFAAFPSFHAALPLVISLFFFIRCPKLRFYGWLSGAFAVLVGFAVVYLGEHWTIDVLGGYALAAAVAWLCSSRHMLAVYRRIPGDPIGRLARLNERIYAAREPDVEPEPIPLPERWAA